MHRLKTLFRHSWQKITRGFSDDITWNLDTELAKWLLPRLKRFKELSQGYPGDLSPEQWAEMLDKMILALEIELHEWDVTFMKMYFGDGERREHEKEMHRKKEEGLKLLSKYLSHLWW